MTIARVADFCTCVVTDSCVIFENGARVSVSFASNMFGGLAAVAAGDLDRMIKDCPSQKSDAKHVNQFKRYEWPDGVVTVSALRAIARAGGTFELEREFCKVAKKAGGVDTYGGAWLSAQAAQAAQAEQAAKARTVKVELRPSEKDELDRLCRAYRERGGNAPEIGAKKGR